MAIILTTALSGAAAAQSTAVVSAQAMRRDSGGDDEPFPLIDPTFVFVGDVQYSACDERTTDANGIFECSYGCSPGERGAQRVQIDLPNVDGYRQVADVSLLLDLSTCSLAQSQPPRRVYISNSLYQTARRKLAPFATRLGLDVAADDFSMELSSALVSSDTEFQDIVAEFVANPTERKRAQSALRDLQAYSLIAGDEEAGAVYQQALAAFVIQGVSLVGQEISPSDAQSDFTYEGPVSLRAAYNSIDWLAKQTAEARRRPSFEVDSQYRDTVTAAEQVVDAFSSSQTLGSREFIALEAAISRAQGS